MTPPVSLGVGPHMAPRAMAGSQGLLYGFGGLLWKVSEVEQPKQWAEVSFSVTGPVGRSVLGVDRFPREWRTFSMHPFVVLVSTGCQPDTT